MNKVDLVMSKKKLRALQGELEDLCDFEKVFHVSCESGFGVDALREMIVEKAKMREWRYHPALTTTKSEVAKAQEAMKQAIMERYFKEIPYQVGIDIKSWVPLLNGALRIEFDLDVRNKIQIGMILGQRGRILGEVRKRCQQLLMEQLGRPVTCIVYVKTRRFEPGIQNQLDEDVVVKNMDPNLKRRRQREQAERMKSLR